MGEKAQLGGDEAEVDGSAGSLERWLNPTLLRVLALVAVLAAAATFALAVFAAEDFTGAWGTATVALLALAASLFSAAASTATVQSGRRSAAAAVTSAQAATTSAASGERSADAATSSAQSGERSAEAAADSATAAQRAYGQQLYELARATHRDLTTGEVAAARDLLGTVGRRRRTYWWPIGDHAELEGLGEWVRSPGYADGQAQLEDTRRSWFTVLWCFQRVLAARQVLERAETGAPPGASFNGESPREFLDRLVADQVRFLNTELSHARAAIEEFFEERLDDRDSAAAFRELVSLFPADGREAELGRWSWPLATHAGAALRVLLRAAPSATLVPEDLTASQYQALHAHLDRFGAREGGGAGDRAAFARQLFARREQLRIGRPLEHTGVEGNPDPPDLGAWEAAFRDLSTPPNPPVWHDP